MDISVSVSALKKISETELLTFLINYAQENDFPFALWRLPDASLTHFLISHHQRKVTDESAIEDLEPGFLFSPFDPEKSSFFLAADFLFTFTNGQLRDPQNKVEASSLNWLEREYRPVVIKPKNVTNTVTKVEDDGVNFLHLVNRCLDEIEKGTFVKIVPSRKKTITLPMDFSVVNAFKKLLTTYEHALVSVVSIPEAGTWVGATPEILVSIEDKRYFRTVALAGTQAYTEGTNLKAVAWTQKEIEEQALVERYIICCFKKIRVREYEEQGPKTVVAGNLIHLKSDFLVDMKAIDFPQLGSVMLGLLHPTSAVCGMPLNTSMPFLKANEGYDREFYSGYLGPVNIDNNINIFVNLRCMRVHNQTGVLYAGAGVTTDSIPEEELEETEMKFNTLLNVIF